ncbi:MAG: alpha/beta hydrolase [Pseudomonadota bacterium]
MDSNRLNRRRLIQVLAGLPVATCLLPACASSGSPAAARPAGPALRRFYVDGRYGQIHVYRAEPDIPAARRQHPLMCFHPTAVSGNYYRDFMLEMGRDRTVLAMDTPGYGRSDRPPEPQPMSGLAGAAADTLDALGYGNNGRGAVDVLGYHTGVFIATELAVLRPDLVRRLVLPGIAYYPPGEERQRLYDENAKPKPLTEDGSGVMDIWKFWVGNRTEGVSLERGAEHFADHLQSGPYSWWAYHSVFSYAAEERLPLVKQPVLVPNTHGSLEEQTRAAAALFPNVQLLEMPELHHGIFDVGVERLSEVTRKFLDAE